MWRTGKPAEGQKWPVRINMACKVFAPMSPGFLKWTKKAALFYRDLWGKSAVPRTTTETTLKYQIGAWGFGAVCAYIKPHIMCLCVQRLCLWAASSTYPDYEDPFDEGEAETWDGPVAAGGWGGQTEGQEEADPVEEERHWMQKRGEEACEKQHLQTREPQRQAKKRKLTEESEHEDAVVPYPQLIDILEVVSGQVFILWSNRGANQKVSNSSLPPFHYSMTSSSAFQGLTSQELWQYLSVWT